MEIALSNPNFSNQLHKRKLCRNCILNKKPNKTFCRGVFCEMCQERHCLRCGSCSKEPESEEVTEDDLSSEGERLLSLSEIDSEASTHPGNIANLVTRHEIARMQQAG